MQLPLDSYSSRFFGVVGITVIGMTTYWMARDLMEYVKWMGTDAFDADSYFLYSLILAAVNISAIVIICVKMVKKMPGPITRTYS